MRNLTACLAALVLLVSHFAFASQATIVLPTTGVHSGLDIVNRTNSALAATASMQSGATDPGALGAYTWWADTGNNLLKQRNAADSAWVTIAPLGAPLAQLSSPALTGTPTAPTASVGTNNTQIATTAFVQAASASGAYTPTLSSSQNVTGVSIGQAIYSKVGNIVTVSGYFVGTITATSTLTVVTITKPIASSTNNGLGKGVATIIKASGVGMAGFSSDDSATDIDIAVHSPSVTGSVSFYYTHQYSIN